MNKPSGLDKIVIVGGDVTGWTVAAAIANSLRGHKCTVTLLDVPDIINVEPVQYTAPSTLEFFRHIGVDEDELIRQTGATLRLGTGIHYRNRATDHRILAFGDQGGTMGVVPFHHYVARQRLSGVETNLNQFSATAMAARQSRVVRPSDPDASTLPPIGYGLNMNTEKLTRLLRNNATINGVRALHQGIDSVDLHPASGYIRQLRLTDESTLAGDLFIDCSGEAALLIGATMGVAFEDWREYLPCSRTVAATTRSAQDDTPVHHIAARDDGWISSTPLRHRAAHRFLYPPEFVSDDEAAARLRAHLGAFEAEAFSTHQMPSGRRREMWACNCVAIGSAAAFVEPLDLSTLHMTQRAAMQLAAMLPATPATPALATEFNRRVGEEYESLRDFTHLHYVASFWRRSEFWREMAAYKRPRSLQRKIDLYRSRGHIRSRDNDVWPLETWIAALMSADIWPDGYHPLLDSFDSQQLDQHFGRMRQAIAQATSRMRPHREYLAALDNQET
jgi:tryptophan halogenase